MDFDTTHITIEALRRLLPEAVIAGGSFVHWLPRPGSVNRADRRLAFRSTQAAAAERCVHSLARSIGLADNVHVPTGEGGERCWPSGFVGSLTHKGTVVLGAVAESTVFSAIGIDLERFSGRPLAGITHIVNPEEQLLSRDDREVRTLQALAAKEAVFKAQYPITHRRLDFSDVRLEWAPDSGEELCGVAVCTGTRPFTVRGVWATKWLLCVAYIPA